MKNACALLIILLVGCNYTPVSSEKPKSYSISEIPFDETECSGFGTVTGGYEEVGFRLSAHDNVTGNSIILEWDDFAIKDAASGGSHTGGYSCFLTDPTYPIRISTMAQGYIQPQLELTLQTGKLYHIDIAMQPKPSCYVDEANKNTIEMYLIGFGLENGSFNLKCTDSNINRGGHAEGSGLLLDGTAFSFLHRWGWCSSGGADCGDTRCFSARQGSIAFAKVKEKLCSDIRSIGFHDDYMCIDPAYNTTEDAKKKCLAGEYEYTSGDIKTISIIQHSDRCGSFIEKGPEDCLSIY
jgi:hypothetical protein